MSNLIDRQAAIDALERGKDKSAKGDIGGFYNRIIQKDIDRIMQLPSAEPQTGKWERKMDGIFCSNCHKGWDFIRGVPAEVETEYKFCPRCGKRMEVDNEQ